MMQVDKHTRLIQPLSRKILSFDCDHRIGGGLIIQRCRVIVRDIRPCLVPVYASFRDKGGSTFSARVEVVFDRDGAAAPVAVCDDAEPFFSVIVDKAREALRKVQS